MELARPGQLSNAVDERAQITTSCRALFGAAGVLMLSVCTTGDRLFFFNLAFFFQKFTFKPLKIVILTLDPRIGAVTYDTELTRLGVIGYSAELRDS